MLPYSIWLNRTPSHSHILLTVCYRGVKGGQYSAIWWDNGSHVALAHIDAAALLRAQVQEVHGELDGHFKKWLCRIAPATPPAGSLAVALYVHAATVEDVTVQSLLRHGAPMYQTDWAGKGPSRYSTADLVPVRAYAHQVFAATDAYLAALSPTALGQKVDLSRHGLGTPTVAWIVSKFVILQLARICGEFTHAVQSS
jgi:hypothetical protein